MKPRCRAAGEPQFPERPDGTAGSTSFEVDARIGHAWFARPEVPKMTGEKGSGRMPALRKAELILAKQGRAIARRATRVPVDAIVKLGAALSPPPRKRRPLKPVGASVKQAANDNSGLNNMTILREIAFLLIFGATLAGTYFLGRAHASHTVISVPEPTRGNAVVGRALQLSEAR